jgi:hypothetical protein
MVKYVSQPQLFGKMLKLAVEFQDGFDTKVDKAYRVVWSTVRYKKQVESTDNYMKYLRHWKVFGIKIVYVDVHTINKKFKKDTNVSAWFILRKHK